MNEQTLREAFEEWATLHGYILRKQSNGDYFYLNTRRMWSAWQAAARWADK